MLAAFPYLAGLLVSLFSLIFGFFGRIIPLALSLGLGSILAALGVGWISYEGFGYLLDELWIQVSQYFEAVPLSVLQIMGKLKVDVAMNIIFSAYVTRLMIRNVYSSFKKISFGNPSV
jgi:hypothetical protein